jgi:hypothetical protein
MRQERGQYAQDRWNDENRFRAQQQYDEETGARDDWARGREWPYYDQESGRGTAAYRQGRSGMNWTSPDDFDPDRGYGRESRYSREAFGYGRRPFSEMPGYPTRWSGEQRFRGFPGGGDWQWGMDPYGFGYSRFDNYSENQRRGREFGRSGAFDPNWPADYRPAEHAGGQRFADPQYRPDLYGQFYGDRMFGNEGGQRLGMRDRQFGGMYESGRQWGGMQGRPWNDRDDFFFGRGPKGYQRSHERIREDVCESLTRNWDIDASDIDVEVKGGEVFLKGVVRDREQKRWAEFAAEGFPGVKDINNQLRVDPGRQTAGAGAAAKTGARTTV